MATDASLKDLRAKSLFVMRNLSFGMMGMQVITYAIADRQFAEFVNNAVMVTSTASVVFTELWAHTHKGVWMVIASISIQLAAILIFFVLVGLISQFVRGFPVFVVSALPLAYSLMAWRHFRAYNHIQKLDRKAR